MTTVVAPARCPVCPRRQALPVEVTVTRPSYWPGGEPMSEDFCRYHGERQAALVDEYCTQAGLALAVVAPITTNGS